MVPLGPRGLSLCYSTAQTELYCSTARKEVGGLCPGGGSSMENYGAKGPEGSSGLEGDSAKSKRPKLLQFTYFHFETLPIPLNSCGFDNYFF